MATVTRQWFQPGEGIAREVITADIQRYLGPDALVRPGEGTAEYEGVQGYWITAYRTLTSQMVQDLRLDSQRWRAEVQQGRVAYQDSRTHQSRQYYGPTTAPAQAPAPAPNPAEYPRVQQQPQGAAYPPQPNHQNYPPEPSYTYQPPQPGYGQQPSYTYDQGQGQARAPGYSYAQPSAGQEAHYANAQPRYTYSQQPQNPAPPREQAYPPQPSAPQTYYTADGRAYTANQPPQANDSRRRRQG